MSAAPLDGRTVAGRLVQRASSTLACTEGQVYTIAIGLVVAVVLAVLGVPPALEDRPAATAPVADLGGPSSPGGTAAGGAAGGGRSVDGAPTVDPPDVASSVNDIADATSDVAASVAGPAVGAAEEPGSAAAPTTAPAEAPLAPGEARRFAGVPAPGRPDGVAVAADGTVWVTTAATPARLLAYGRDGTLEGNVVLPGGPLAGITIDRAGSLVVADAGRGHVLRVDADTGRVTADVALPDLAPCGPLPTGPSPGAAPCEPGVSNRRPAPRGVAVDSGGSIFVTDAGQATLWRIPPDGGAPESWHASLDYAGDRGLAGVTVLPDRSVVVAVGSSLGLDHLASGVLHRIARGPTGAAGTRSTFASLAPGDVPDGLAATMSGGVVVSLPDADSILVVADDGTVGRRIASPTGASAFSAPTALAFRGTSVLVANRGTDSATSWSLVGVGVGERGVS